MIIGSGPVSKQMALEAAAKLELQLGEIMNGKRKAGQSYLDETFNPSGMQLHTVEDLQKFNISVQGLLLKIMRKMVAYDRLKQEKLDLSINTILAYHEGVR